MPKGAYKIKENPHYPYGTQMRMDKDMMEGMGMMGMEVGDMVEVRGYAKITAKSEMSDMSDMGGNPKTEMSMDMQMTEMMVNRMMSNDDKMMQRMGDMYPGEKMG